MGCLGTHPSVYWSDGVGQEAVNSKPHGPFLKSGLDVGHARETVSSLVPSRAEQEGQKVLAWQVLCFGVCSPRTEVEGRPCALGVPEPTVPSLVLHL